MISGIQILLTTPTEEWLLGNTYVSGLCLSSAVPIKIELGFLLSPSQYMHVHSEIICLSRKNYMHLASKGLHFNFIVLRVPSQTKVL